MADQRPPPICQGKAENPHPAIPTQEIVGHPGQYLRPVCGMFYPFKMPDPDSDPRYTIYLYHLHDPIRTCFHEFHHYLGRLAKVKLTETEIDRMARQDLEEFSKSSL